MSKKIWILNHYATDTFFERGGRHYWFAKYLIRAGYDVRVFCASTQHGNMDDIQFSGLYLDTVSEDGIPYTFVRTPSYKGNGMDRVKNMIAFYLNVKKVCKLKFKEEKKPDVILASSVHPLTLVAGINLGKKFNIPCICEIRDLWPLSIVVYSDKYTNDNLIIKALYKGEKWIYTRADRLIFTMEGGKQYITDKGWDVESGGTIDLNKVNYINNGVDLETYNYNKENCVFDDDDLNSNKKKVIYAGSIRQVNNVGEIIDVAEDMKKYENIIFLIYGDGDQKLELEQKCVEREIDNVKFKGKVEKKFIPFILSKANICLIGSDKEKVQGLTRYGISPNKLFEYMASGKPILIPFSLDGIEWFENYGIAKNIDSKEEYVNTILKAINFNKPVIEPKEFDFKYLTDELVRIIEGVVA